MTNDGIRGLRGLMGKSTGTVDASVELRTDVPGPSEPLPKSASEPVATSEAPDDTKVYPGEPKPVLGILIGLVGPATGQIFAVTGAESVLGRSEACPIRIESEYVSPRQLRIIHERGRFAVQALRGPNPVLLNGAVLKEPAELHDGDTLAIANTRLSFRTATPPSSS